MRELVVHYDETKIAGENTYGKTLYVLPLIMHLCEPFWAFSANFPYTRPYTPVITFLINLI